MVKKLNILKNYFFLIIILSSCSLKSDLSNNDFEEIYNFKSKSILVDKNSKKVLKEFIIYDHISKNIRSKVMEKCNNYQKKENLNDAQCKLKFVKFTNKINSSIE
tara:strand:+ start:304 stop:618 length:315 start_codon:yes stop_codon:yes gene_type:complete